VRRVLREQFARLHKMVLDRVRSGSLCRRLMTVPGDSDIMPTISLVRRQSVTAFIPVAGKQSLLLGAIAKVTKSL